MSAARRAWVLSLTLHTAALAGMLALAARMPPTLGPVAIETRAPGDMAVGLVLLDTPAPRPPQVPQPLPPMPVALPVQVAPPTVPSVIQTVAYPEPPPLPNRVRQSVPPVIEGPVPSTSVAPPVAAPSAVQVQVPVAVATTFFDVPAIGKSVVYVIDRSASMGLAGRLERAKREVVASLRLLPPTAKFQVIAYDRRAGPLVQSGMLPATPDAVAAAVAVVERLSAEGATDHLQALRSALALGPDVIYFLTDEDELMPKEVTAFTGLNHGRVCVHALCLVAPLPGVEAPMQALARTNRGVFRVVRD